MTQEPKTPEYTLRAIRSYRDRGVQKQITFNPRRSDEAELLAAIDADKGVPFATLVKQLLYKHYDIESDDGA